MSEQKHRPGPWILSEYETHHPITLELRKGCEIFCNRNNKVICEIPDYRFHPEDDAADQADARLISAAPELLAALETFPGFCSDATDSDAWIEQVRTALSRARGEE
ncbi:hypothetical protein QN382_19965 [Pseudomonas sp. 10B1]|uniref:hypothetical protein n=1 Tax=unclassified Pseudomonas TaxID=196821 RepID=UPI002B23C019|nr:MULTISPECIES: hypothetical protein [unclassified Pseudomonas]MEA9994580.1 hypothetical protein [Pseudomonas sp. AA4]MEB0085725.1 hypothetical protein [Pseudomonas sp. RTI1]MEB0125950.1 hypothetical protein [Pseudomonas sp. CCC1.2]MEB0152754.1 hypothetical protein [Pseudomonas sp. CCC4.3]MEB0221259.1 hypothetical protein [Pseudomonas sp. AB12(2023)]